MKIKTGGLDHVHVYVNDLTAVVVLLGQSLESDETLPSVVESIGSYNAQVRFPGSTAAPFLDMFEAQFHPADTAGFQLGFVQYEPDADKRIAEIQKRKRAGQPVEGLRLRASVG